MRVGLLGVWREGFARFLSATPTDVYRWFTGLWFPLRKTISAPTHRFRFSCFSCSLHLRSLPIVVLKDRVDTVLRYIRDRFLVAAVRQAYKYRFSSGRKIKSENYVLPIDCAPFIRGTCLKFKFRRLSASEIITVQIPPKQHATKSIVGVSDSIA